MVKVNCCIKKCESEKDAAKGQKIVSYKFPTEPKRRKIWIKFAQKCNGRGPYGRFWNPTQKSEICSNHFLGYEKHQHFLHPGYNPTVASGTQEMTTQEIEEKFQAAIAETVRKHKMKFADYDLKRGLATKDRGVQTSEPLPKTSPLIMFSCFSSDGRNLATQVNHEYTPPPVFKEAAVGSDLTVSRFFGYDSVRDSEALQKLTSIPQKVFNNVLATLNYTPHTIRKEDALLAFFAKLKLKISFRALSVFFNMSDITIGCNFYHILEKVVDREFLEELEKPISDHFSTKVFNYIMDRYQ